MDSFLQCYRCPSGGTVALWIPNLILYIHISVPGKFYRKFFFCIDMFLKRDAGIVAIITWMVLRIYSIIYTYMDWWQLFSLGREKKLYISLAPYLGGRSNHGIKISAWCTEACCTRKAGSVTFATSERLVNCLLCSRRKDVSKGMKLFIAEYFQLLCCSFPFHLKFSDTSGF